MVPINNYEIYDTRMRKSLIDKAFFLDKTDAEVFVDFGCADGALIELMATLFPEYIYIGYDNDEAMVDLARKRLGKIPARKTAITVQKDWKDVEYILSMLHGKKKCLILSSVIHEVYNYSSDSEIQEFWKQVTDSGFDYVAIRDMTRSWYFGDKDTLECFELNPDVDWQTVEHVRRVCRMNKWDKHLEEFEERYGGIESERNLYHFLLKYRYVENWDREVGEDYFIASTQMIQSMMPTREWDMLLCENYVLPFNARQVKKDFDFAMKRPTHTKMIFERLK